MLIDRYKEDFIKAALLLKTLQCDPKRLDVILKLHKLIIRAIVKQEKLIKFDRSGCRRLEYYRKNKKPNSIISKSIKKTVSNIRERINQRKHIIFIYKCYGDGIAYNYQSMYALKHLYYNSKYQIKEDAGFISGKIGFLQEWKIFLKGLKYNVPVVMSDITNVIRNGDVCALGGQDPVPIEVKLTKNENLSARSRRQIAHLSEISSFYCNDFSPQFRGGIDTYRTPLKYEQINYINDINELIRNCSHENHCYKKVEDGLIYFCLSTEINEKEFISAEECMKSLISNSSTLTIALTPDEQWMEAYPFTLSLTPSNLISFIYGNICIYIFIDLEVVRKMFIHNKIHATFLMDGISAVQICKDPNDLLKGVFRVSESNFLRNAISFLSIRIFVDECSKLLSDDLLTPRSITNETYERLLNTGQVVDNATIEAWSKIKDCLKNPDDGC